MNAVFSVCKYLMLSLSCYAQLLAATASVGEREFCAASAAAAARICMRRPDGSRSRQLPFVDLLRSSSSCRSLSGAEQRKRIRRISRVAPDFVDNDLV